ncbi:MAG: efflux RND transporter permease subunit, partial [Bdellovibrionota bacterium]
DLEQRSPMGISVIGGLISSTILTLLVIPCVFSVLDDGKRFLLTSFQNMSIKHLWALFTK